MQLEKALEEIRGHYRIRLYKCPCGNGVVRETYNTKVSTDSTDVEIECPECKEHYFIDYSELRPLSRQER